MTVKHVSSVNIYISVIKIFESCLQDQYLLLTFSKLGRIGTDIVSRIITRVIKIIYKRVRSGYRRFQFFLSEKALASFLLHKIKLLFNNS